MHLDFKPENVLVTAMPACAWWTLNLAQPILEKPKKASRKNPGTRLHGADNCRRADQPSRGYFRLRRSAYELLTNQKPFPGETPGEILAKELDRSGFVAPRSIMRTCPPASRRSFYAAGTRSEARYPFIGMMVREFRRRSTSRFR